jgi:hypothetical protein
MALIYAGDPDDPRTVSNPAPVQIFAGTTPTGSGTSATTAGLELPLTGAVFDASIEAGGAAFEAKLSAAPGQRVIVEVFGVGSGRNVSLSILGPDGTELVKRDDWGNGFGERIWGWEPTAAGNYKVRVSAASSSGRTDFSLRGFLLQETVNVGERQGQSILFNLPTQWGLDQGPLALDAVATSGLAPELDLVGGAASMQGTKLDPTGEGTLTLRARQDGSGTFSPAAPVTKTVNIVARGENFEQWMKRHFGTNANTEQLRTLDSDNDGRSNLQEYQAATDPRNAQSIFQPQAPQRNGEAFEVRWEAKRGIKYRVLSSTNLSTWQEEPASRRTGTGATVTHRDTDTTNRVRKFYKIEIVE